MAMTKIRGSQIRDYTVGKSKFDNTVVDGSGKLLASLLPSSIAGSLSYQGAYDAATDAPAIPAADASNKGYYYVVSVAGAGASGITPADLQIGDWIVSNGSSWDKIDNTEAFPFRFMGTVDPGTADLAAPSDANRGHWYQVSVSGTSAQAGAVLAGDYVFSTGSAWKVISQNAEGIAIDNALGFSAPNVQAAIEDLSQRFKYKGTYDASADSPAIPAADASNEGQYYIVSFDGPGNANTPTPLKAGDWLVTAGTNGWKKITANVDSTQVVYASGGPGQTVDSALYNLHQTVYIRFYSQIFEGAINAGGAVDGTNATFEINNLVMAAIPDNIGGGWTDITSNANLAKIDVYINGLLAVPGADYTLHLNWDAVGTGNCTRVVFLTPPDAGDRVYMKYTYAA